MPENEINSPTPALCPTCHGTRRFPGYESMYCPDCKATGYANPEDEKRFGKRPDVYPEGFFDAPTAPPRHVFSFHIDYRVEHEFVLIDWSWLFLDATMLITIPFVLNLYQGMIGINGTGPIRGIAYSIISYIMLWLGRWAWNKQSPGRFK